MLHVVLFITTVFTVIACIAYEFRAAWVVLPALGLAVLAICGGAGAGLMLILIGLMAVAGICRCYDMRTRSFAAGCAGVAVVSLGAWALSYLPTYREHQKLLEEHPFVNLEERLSYEVASGSADPADAGDSRVNPPDAALNEPGDTSIYTVMTRLETESGQSYRIWDRSRSLESLANAHNGFVADFVAENGQGISRMRRISARRDLIELPEPPPLELPKRPAATSESLEAGRGPVAALNAPAAPAAFAEALPAAVPESTVLLRTHESGLVDFVNPEGFGFVASRNQVLGFQSHAFRKIPTLAPADAKTAGWQVVSLELVSLLKHDPPAAYVSKHLPRMEELRDAPTRALDRFENDGLAKLRSGEELVVVTTVDELRMLGPLRAYQECLQCHQVKVGALLGAFTYRLRPVSRQVQPVNGKTVL